MAHVVEESSFGAINFSQRLRTFSFGLIGARVGDTRRDLTGNETQKSGVTDIERTVRIQRGDQHTCRSALCLTRDGQQKGSPWSLIPGPTRKRIVPRR